VFFGIAVVDEIFVAPSGYSASLHNHRRAEVRRPVSVPRPAWVCGRMKSLDPNLPLWKYNALLYGRGLSKIAHFGGAASQN